ncbi:MAG: type II toxin-antitoxin system prevent-host-death family antitoxin [Geodermatophilaceae bacterium]|nr:type II toxin-antitoxin system prevent-host-death family antitoxin [Geodermatophilaceae bacterium]
MSSLSVTAALAALPELLDRVQRGEEVTITRHGRPLAVLVRPDSRRADAAFSAAPRSWWRSGVPTEMATS